MSERILSSSLADLEQRLQKERAFRAQKAAVNNRTIATPGRQIMGLAFQVSFRFVAPLCLLGGAGILLDDLLVTAPVFQVALFIIGAVVGFRAVYHIIHQQMEAVGVVPQQLRGLSVTPLVPGRDSSGWNSPRGI